MTWRDHTWEFVVVAVSWFVAIGALALVAAFVVLDALKAKRQRRRKGAS